MRRLKTFFQSEGVQMIPPLSKKSPIGAGAIFRGKKFITHSKLSDEHIALNVLVPWQKFFLISGVVLFIFAFLANSLLAVTAILAVISIVYFADVFFTTFLVLKSLGKSPEIVIEEEEFTSANEDSLPTYSILCPLYHEAEVLPQFVKNMALLVYPQKKLEILLLLEENDQRTISEAMNLKLPRNFKIVIVPDSMPKTKPKACNFGLSKAKGEFVVIFDAEDQPEPWQLVKSALAFKKSNENVCCLQAKLNYYNPHHNLLTKLFTVEYSLWFDLILPAYQSINTAIPLGGTSNHFKRKVLLKIGGWDAFNVTEDCDLGMRLFKEGFKTALFDSETLEEANSDLSNWIRQRSRWIKGYLQTFLVHTRKPVELTRTLKWHALIFNLVVGARTIFMLINPILWIMTISYFLLYRFVGPTIESFYPAPIFYMAAFSLVAGNFLYLYNYMIAAARRGQWGLIKYVFFVPFYWVLVSLAAIKAFKQLVFQPHFWEKTNHGLHLMQSEKFAIPSIPWNRVLRPELFAAGFLIFSTLLNYFLNFLYNAFLTRSSFVSVSEFGLITLMGSFVYLISIPMGAIIRTVAHQSAFHFGKSSGFNSRFWAETRSKVLVISITVALVWVSLIPLLQVFFNSKSPIPFLIFTPVWIIAAISAVDVGFLSGSLKFSFLAWLLLVEALVRLILTISIVSLGFSEWVYLATPISMSASLFLGFFWANRIKGTTNENLKFSKKFFLSSVVLNLSSAVYLGGDTVLAQHFLSPVLAGQYAVLSLVGKMVFFLGSTFSQFVVPVVSRAEGIGKSSGKYFSLFFLGTLAFGAVGFLFFGVFGSITVPFFWGQKSLGIISFLPTFCLASLLFAISGTIVNFHQSQKKRFFASLGFALSLIQVFLIVNFHQTIEAFVRAALISSSISFLVLLAMHYLYPIAPQIRSNLEAFRGLFSKIPQGESAKLRILVFNWRDTKHVWAGGAELYVQELSKRWVSWGNSVTIFCGNDGKSPRSEEIDGVKIIRRGGFYFVYVWAFLYYIFKLRGKFDVIIDCENGIPFFTPFYAKERVVLLIHHVHKDLFKVDFRPPVSWIGPILEKHLLRLCYRNVKVVTVSESSKKEILENQLTKLEPAVIHNGVDLKKFRPGKKSKNPIILYLGRLRFHKSVDIFIKTAKNIVASHANVKFVIAGDGQQRGQLETLVKKLNLSANVEFLGSVSEEKKVELYQKAWVFVNPSMMEGWGVTTIEANACGTPVVASNVPGLRDSVSNPHTGFLVKFGDVPRFTNRILALIDNRRFRIESGKYAVSWASKFDWDKSALSFIEILKNEK